MLNAEPGAARARRRLPRRQLEIAVRLGSTAPGGGVSAAEQRYNQLRARLTPVEPADAVYATLKEYLDKSHAKLHSGCVAPRAPACSVRFHIQCKGRERCRRGNSRAKLPSARATS